MSEWISVKDRLPEMYGHYLTVNSVFRKGKAVRSFTKERWWDMESRDDPSVRGFYTPDGWMHVYDFSGDSITVGVRVTHWMPLPKPPESANN